MEHPAVEAFVAELVDRAWVRDVWLHGSVATGDHHPGVSDIDIVATTTRPLDTTRVVGLERMHRMLDASWPGTHLGCTYAEESGLTDLAQTHPTWTHGRLLSRPLSRMVQAELLDHGRVLCGREPADVLDPMSTEDVRDAVRRELRGYWAWASRRPWLFVSSAHADLALLSMARARVTLDTGALVTKTEAAEHVHAPSYIVDDLRRRRTGSLPPTSFAPVLAHHSWHDTRRTVAEKSHAP